MAGRQFAEISLSSAGTYLEVLKLERTAEWNNRIAEGVRSFLAGLSEEEKEVRLTKSFLSPEAKAKGHSSIPCLDRVSEEDKQWVVGFWEGDGTPSLTNSNKSFDLFFFQKESQVLEYIKGLVGGGSLSLGHGYDDLYHLGFYGWDRCLPLLCIFSQYLVGRYRVGQLNKLFDKVGFPFRFEEHEPTLPWVVGFFDAEGGTGLWERQFDLSFTQTRDKQVLEKIQRVLGGRIQKEVGKLYLRVEDIRRFLPVYLTYSKNLQKRNKILSNLFCIAQVSKTWRTYIDNNALLRRYLP